MDRSGITTDQRELNEVKFCSAWGEKLVAGSLEVAPSRAAMSEKGLPGRPAALSPHGDAGICKMVQIVVGRTESRQTTVLVSNCGAGIKRVTQIVGGRT